MCNICIEALSIFAITGSVHMFGNTVATSTYVLRSIQPLLYVIFGLLVLVYSQWHVSFICNGLIYES